MADSVQSWELRVKRSRTERRGTKVRTIGSYQVCHNGEPVEGLSGFVCESRGPGDNKTASNGKRIEAGKSYPLYTHGSKGTRYSTLTYSKDGDPTKQKPGIGVRGTGKRSAILIHPGHPPTLFLSSVGCLNPTRRLAGADSDMNFDDSRARTIALIDDLKTYLGNRFPGASGKRIPDATLVITGEP